MVRYLIDTACLAGTPTRKTCSAGTLRRTKDNPFVICAAARSFSFECEIEKARWEWFGARWCRIAILEMFRRGG